MINSRIASVTMVSLLIALYPTTSNTSAKQRQTPTKTPAKATSLKRPGSITVGGKQIRIGKDHMSKFAKLKKLGGVTVLYPRFVPKRFRLIAVAIDVLESDPVPDYSIEFEDQAGETFFIESAHEGLGSPPDGSRTLEGKSRTLGSFKINVFKPRSEGNDTDSTYYLSDWLVLQSQAEEYEKNPNLPVYHFYGNGVSDKEAVRIVDSLTPIE